MGNIKSTAIIVGIDTHKSTHVAVAIDTQGATGCPFNSSKFKGLSRAGKMVPVSW